MADDIVTRLRYWAACSIDTGRVDAPADFTAAADEIERLREQLRLANIDNFNTTAEVDRLRDELARNADECRETLTELRQRVETLRSERDEANANAKLYRDERERMREMCDVLRAIAEQRTSERDEARRSCCEYAAIVDGADTADGMESGRFYEIAMKYMKDRGWDCFKEPVHAS